ncbi:DivIVA domain-containing protein [Actinoplanes sp. KI2]|uniref:DivIVA domain-containing protein n=1 Tax=Actinoplanes sp. KI2 TaxID=2983315 RepID=UPI0021D57E24|nr:DivIVA domain-containing protein [Actinoplanes sp. KI2]MCU7722679.1 DivIVA domain-containing protein [Actinoplanes sp. KI2]
MNRDFTVVLRGYDRTEVDRALGRAEAALTSGSESRRAASLAELGKDFTVVLRGYDRQQVQQAVAVLATALREPADQA